MKMPTCQPSESRRCCCARRSTAAASPSPLRGLSCLPTDHHPPPPSWICRCPAPATDVLVVKTRARTFFRLINWIEQPSKAAQRTDSFLVFLPVSGVAGAVPRSWRSRNTSPGCHADSQTQGPHLSGCSLRRPAGSPRTGWPRAPHAPSSAPTHLPPSNIDHTQPRLCPLEPPINCQASTIAATDSTRYPILFPCQKIHRESQSSLPH